MLFGGAVDDDGGGGGECFLFAVLSREVNDDLYGDRICGPLYGG